MTRILVVDDELAVGKLVRMSLELTGRFEVRHEARPKDVVEAAKEFRPDLIVFDVLMPGIHGHELAAQVLALEGLADTRLLFLTGTARRSERTMVVNGRPFEVLSKPIRHAELVAGIDRALAAGCES